MIRDYVDITAEWRAIDPINADDTAHALMCPSDDDERKPYFIMYAVRIFMGDRGYTDLHRIEAETIFGASQIAEFERQALEYPPVTE